MTPRAYTREDVSFHSDGWRDRRPAVNVKVRGSITDRDVWEEFRTGEEPDPEFTLEWIEENVSDETIEATFWQCCESEFDYLEAWATQDEDRLFPDDRVTLEREGRSGGWIAVDGLPALDEWDAIRLARWRKFERVATEIAQGIPYQMLASLYLNEYEWAKDEQAERDRAANQDIATVTLGAVSALRDASVTQPVPQ